MRRGRLIIAVVTTLLDEALVLVLILWGLPMLGVKLPLPILIIIGLLWTGFAVLMYIAGTKALRRKPVTGLSDMIDTKGKVAKILKPDGMVKINGELWAATSSDGETIQNGVDIIVESQNGLKLIVRKSSL